MASKPSVYLDSCCLIDAVKSELGNTLTPDRDADAWFVRQMLRAHRAGDMRVYTSTLSIAECVATEPGQAVVPTDAQERFRRLLTSGQYLILVQQTPRTWQMAQEIRWTHNLVLGGADAIHVAAFLEKGAEEFITLDERLKKPKMRAVADALGTVGRRFARASDTQALPTDYRQESMLG